MNAPPPAKTGMIQVCQKASGSVGVGVENWAHRGLEPVIISTMQLAHNDVNGQPLEDENGVDLSLIRYCLSLTPDQRLQRAQDFANFILNARRENGVQTFEQESSQWEETHSTGNNSFAGSTINASSTS